MKHILVALSTVFLGAGIAYAQARHRGSINARPIKSSASTRESPAVN